MAFPISILFLILSLLSLSSAFTPKDHYLLNCGSSPSSHTLDPFHRSFSGFDADASKFLTSNPPSPLYRTARAFTRPTYFSFPISDVGSHHFIRLHFFLDLNNNPHLNDAVFHVVADDFLLLRNFRFHNNSIDGITPVVIKEFIIPLHSDQLKIWFLPSDDSKFGFVNAIEVISAPNDLIADVAQRKQSETIDGLLRNGFETVYRVNVGGFKVTPFNDSLWRNWETDEGFLKSSEKTEKVYSGGRINYQLGGASREVGPDNVYNTARLIKSVDGSIPSVNLTWEFPVEMGIEYMLRLHFCDIASPAAWMLYFNVYVDGNLAYENLDLTDKTNGMLASPFYADFVVEASSGVLVVSVGPSNMSQPRAVDAILNGIEVWKMNNSMGSFDGEVCAGYLVRSWKRGHVGALLPLMAAVFLLLVAAMVLVQRRRTASVGWSRLPVDVSESNFKVANRISSVKG